MEKLSILHLIYVNYYERNIYNFSKNNKNKYDFQKDKKKPYLKKVCNETLNRYIESFIWL